MEPNPIYIKNLLDQMVDEYNRLDFITDDPVSIPHRFSEKEDIEISGFLTATISWGQRKTIIQNAAKWMDLMDNAPFQFILHHSEKDLGRLLRFTHRTFNAEDCIFFIRSLRNIYQVPGGMESLFHPPEGMDLKEGIMAFRRKFFSLPYPPRSSKHIADPSRGASAKRINMFLRWMVRKDDSGVDFGIWNGILPSQLYCPLDVHTGNSARQLGILNIRQDNWKAVEELTYYLRMLDPQDPVKYDYALFGMGLQKDFL
jgi:uncharacterized protein (TIGR02757 family)